MPNIAISRITLADDAVPRPRIAVAPAGQRAWLADAVRRRRRPRASTRPRPRVSCGPRRAGRTTWPALLAGARASAGCSCRGPASSPSSSVLDHAHVWTCGKGVYAEPVAEHALTLALAGLRRSATYARAPPGRGPQGENLSGRR